LGVHSQAWITGQEAKTLINADESLQAVFNGKKQVSMFEMTKLVSGHLK
jgi:upstream activation factor subunit UAF30